MLIDTHAHLNFPDYEDISVETILTRAKEFDVHRILNVGTSPATSQASIDLAEKFPEIYAAVGIHPHDAHLTNEADIETLYNWAKQNPKVVAIGEIGLDYFKPQNSADDQQRVFQALLAMSKELELPYIIHNRESSEDILRIIKESNYSNGVLHCFSGDVSFAEEVLRLGLMVSFTGIVTFKNASLVQQAATVVPLDRMMLETDAPFLAPTPYRGQRNEPAYVSLIAEKISELKGEPLAAIKEVTSANALSFFSRMAA